MKNEKNILFLFLFIGLLFFIVSCSSNNISKGNSEPMHIEEFQSDIEDENVQGDSYTIQPENQTTVNNTTNTEKNNKNNKDNDDTVIIIEDNTKDNNNTTKDATESKISILDENGKEVTTTKNNTNTEKEAIVDDLVLVNDDMEEGKNKTDNEITVEATKNLSVEPIPIKGKLGQIFTMEAEETQIVYLFMELLPAKGQSTVEIGKDAIGMLINSINLINNAKNKIGKVNYIVIGVEMKKNDMWYFIASIGDIAAFVKGSIEMEELLKRITVKKGMKNIFN
jgi:hypothetical protein